MDYEEGEDEIVEMLNSGMRFKLTEARISAGMDTEQLSKKSGLSAEKINAFENGSANILPDDFCKLLEACDYFEEGICCGKQKF